MLLECDIIVDTGIAFERSDQLADLLRFAAGFEHSRQGRRCRLTVRLSNDETIADLHRQFFDDPTPTDVITFPSEDDDIVDGECYLGDIVVSVDTAAIQATDIGHSTEREIAFLALHGLLHLCGYDDRTDEDRATMLQRQLEHLEAWEGEPVRPW